MKDIIPILQEAIRLMSEQTFQDAPQNRESKEYCDSACCSHAQMMLEDLVAELQND